MKTLKGERASKLCSEIRELFAIHPKRIGWVASPFHGRRKIRIGHRGAASDQVLRDEVATLVEAVQRLGLAEKFGYTTVAYQPSVACYDPQVVKGETLEQVEVLQQLDLIATPG